ncbi:extracellular solute-binding protein [Paenibacillus sp. YPG26]|uniref:ABC transporter substrate-binding protein n=1 Tax=Paenibacillus sp. YPG26 TaxID=2878915 RepID=UPI00203D5FAC|nr:extracellular solute-binding protein [Paenibacillus sp. YPG26]USB34374.1 extracellular solute-binding protein [Paenibacillus sp. YPG26]
MIRLWRPFMLALLLTMTACSSYVTEMTPISPGIEALKPSQPDKDSKNELLVWTFYDTSDADRNFMILHPDIRVKTVQLKYEEIADAFIRAYGTDESPDVVFLDSSMSGKLNGLDILHDLREQGIEIKDYEQQIPANMLPQYMNLQMNKLVTLPTSLPTAFTYYRADILEQNGFPSNPDKLAVYLSTPQNWVAMAKKLKSKGIYLFQHYTDPIDVASMSSSILNRNLEFAWDSKEFQDAVYVAREIRRNGLALRSTIWDPSGEQALRDGQLAMIYSAPWATDSLKGWAPELTGRWRVTGLPLNLYGYRDGAMLAIAKNSKHKAEAWEYLKNNLSLTRKIDDSGKESYLGGQNPSIMAINYAQHNKGLYPTPLDAELKALWDKNVTGIIESDQSIESQLGLLKEQMEQITSEERSIIKEAIHSSN